MPGPALERCRGWSPRPARPGWERRWWWWEQRRYLPQPDLLSSRRLPRTTVRASAGADGGGVRFCTTFASRTTRQPTPLAYGNLVGAPAGVTHWRIAASLIA